MTTHALTPPRTQTGHDARNGRIVGGLGLVLLVLVVTTVGGGPMFTDASNAEVVRWVTTHTKGEYAAAFMETFAMLLNAAFLGLLAWRARVGSHVRAVIWGLMGASLGIDAVNTGAQFAMAKAAERGAGDGAILGLFSFAEQLTFTDGITWGLVIGVVSYCSLRRRTLPVPVCWLGLLVTAVHVLEIPVQIAVTGSPEGVSGPAGTALLLVWWLATALSLLVRPVASVESTRSGDGGLVD